MEINFSVIICVDVASFLASLDVYKRQALWQARQVCPEIIFVPPRMDLYLRFSRMAQEIYSEYTDQREPFGIDESWLDVTASTSIKGDGMKIAKEISSRITVSYTHLDVYKRQLQDSVNGIWCLQKTLIEIR